jgi:hypothetical protein
VSNPPRPCSNPEIVRLAPQVVQRYAKLYMRRSFSSVETELSHLVSTAEIVIVVDRKSAAHLRAVVEDGGGAGLCNLGPVRCGPTAWATSCGSPRKISRPFSLPIAIPEQAFLTTIVLCWQALAPSRANSLATNVPASAW